MTMTMTSTASQGSVGGRSQGAARGRAMGAAKITTQASEHGCDELRNARKLIEEQAGVSSHDYDSEDRTHPLKDKNVAVSRALRSPKKNAKVHGVRWGY